MNQDDVSRTLLDIRSPGEVVDRLTIAELKIKKHTDPVMRSMCEREAAQLRHGWLSARIGDFEEIEELESLRTVNGAIWHFEHEMRRFEADRTFGAPFMEAVRASHLLNGIRGRYRRSIDEHVKLHNDVTFLHVEAGLDAVIDRIAMGVVVESRKPAKPGERTSSEWREIWSVAGLPDIFRTHDFCELERCHDRLWEVKDALDALEQNGSAPQEEELICRSLYLINDKRCSLRERLATQCGSALVETKFYPVYLMPEDWDDVRLKWREQ